MSAGRSGSSGSWPAAVCGALRRAALPVCVLVAMACTPATSAYQVGISSNTQLRQTCSGMWADPSKGTAIDLTIHKGATGPVATIFYEWQDFPRLGRPAPSGDVLGFQLKMYVCTAEAITQKVCNLEESGQFLFDGPINGTTIRSDHFDFEGGLSADKVLSYPVAQKGYYCVAAVPLQSASPNPRDATFTGIINFKNSFSGQLPAAEWPKVRFYFWLTAAYVGLGVAWFALCLRHRSELLTVQHYISGLLAFLIVEMIAQYGYLSYLNSHAVDFTHISSVDGHKSVTGTARTLLVITSLLDSARNSLSLYLLLCVSMGLGVVRPSLGPVINRVRALTGVHFVFGALYSIGIVLIIIESGGAFILMFILPLSITLSSFMMWILTSLNATIAHLTARKQTFKRMMFTKLYRILLAAAIVIFLFFVVSSFVFSQSGGADFAPRSWPYRWFLLDGWLGVLYMAIFASIAWIWRPTGQNLRMSMSDEIAMDDDAEAGDFEIDTFAQPGGPDEEDAEEYTSHSAMPPSYREASGHSQPQRSGVARDVVFALGDDDDEDEAPRGASKADGEEESRGLMNHDENDSKETLRNGKVGKRD